MAILGVAIVPMAHAQVETAAPEITARSVYMINADNGEVIYSKNPDDSSAMASTTKMMTALLVMENCPDLDSPVTISKRAVEVGESSVWLQEGETLTVRELLYGLLVQSGNDAAVALAEYQGGSVETFVEMMNQRAAELGLEQTHFTNPHGLDDPEHYSSARDLVVLGGELMKYPEIRKIVATTEMTIPWAGHPYGRTLVNHNHLLWQTPAVTGIKTGFTDEAGQCIVVSASDKGINLLVAYMGGQSLAQRDQEVMALLQYAFDSYRQQKVITKGKEYADIDIPFRRGEAMALVSDGDLVKQVYIRDEIEYRVVLPDEMNLPVYQGDKVGLVEAYEGDVYLGNAYLLATQDVLKPGWLGRINYLLDSVYHFLLVTAVGG